MTFRAWILGGAAALAMTSLAGLAQAADAKPDSNEVQEVVVTGRFLATGAQSATKQNLSVMDTPYSVSAYTADFMKSIEVTKVADLYRFMTGVARSGATGYDLTLRGFKTASTDRNAILVDGLPGLTVRFGSPPTVGTDHVELVRGPTSVLYGQGQPGGFVNIITKKPLAHPQLVFDITGQSYIGDIGGGAGSDVAIDATGPLLGDKLLGRAIAEYGNNTGFREHAFDRPFYLAGGLTWNVTADTTATLQEEFRYEKTEFDSYLIAPKDNLSLLPDYATYYQRPGDWIQERGHATTLLVSHDFGGGMHLNVSARDVVHTDHTRGMDVVGFADAANTRLQIRARNVLNNRRYDFGDVNLVAPFKTGFIDHNLIVGVNGGREMSDFDRLQQYTVPTSGAGSYTLDVDHPSYAGIPLQSQFPVTNPGPGGLKGLNDPHTISDEWGPYASDLMTLTEQWKVMVGARYTMNRQTFHEQRAPNVPDRESSVHDFLPLAGVIYQPTHDVSLYASYTTSFVPVLATAVDVNNENHFSPTKANSIEGGVKANLFDNHAQVTASIFDIHKKGVTNSFTVGCPTFIGTCTDQVGEEESKGAELELNAHPIDGWQVIFGYAYNDAKVVKSDDPVTQGAWLTNAPKNSAHLWSRYDFAEGRLAGLGLGLGVSYNGERAGLLPTTKAPDTTTLPAYTLVDLAAYYTFSRYQLTLNLTNLFDKKFIESESLGNTILPGAPRQIRLTLRATFD
jgi:iron complex outermembrane receptor protein